MKFKKNYLFIYTVIIVQIFFHFNPLFAQSNAERLPRGIPEEEGIASETILSFIDEVEKNQLGLHSFMVIRHGKVVSEGYWKPYSEDLDHPLFSLSKSFTSTAIGFAVKEGILNIEDKVVSFFPEESPSTITPNLASMRIRDLLTMTTGHKEDTFFPELYQAYDGNWVKKFLSFPVEYAPESHFVYNSGASYMLGAILQKLTNLSLTEFLTPRFFVPLGIDNVIWDKDPQGVDLGLSGLHLNTEDIGKLGQFYLQKGMWNGQQLLPESWITQATTKQVGSQPVGGSKRVMEFDDWQQGYGFQFWRCRYNAFRADGAFGQFSIVIPEKDAVIAITAENYDGQALMDCIWENLYIGLKDKPLATNKTSVERLKYKLSSLNLFPEGRKSLSPITKSITNKKFVLKSNKKMATSISLDFNKDNCTFSLTDNKGEHKIICGINHWIKGETDMTGEPDSLVPYYFNSPAKFRVSGCCGWKDEHTLIMNWNFLDTPHFDNLIIHIDDDHIQIENITHGFTLEGQYKL